MGCRDRVEDLGRIAEKLDQISKDDIFSMFECRNKEATDWFEKLPDEKKDDFIHSMAYGLSDLEEKILECWNIARFGDDPEE